MMTNLTYFGVKLSYVCLMFAYRKKYVVKHKSAKLFMMYAVGKLEAALTIIKLLAVRASYS